ncbi:MAG: segregation/condensation protein A [Phycisphaerales bacterium]|nr:MAG: segregation/condensation protein A [Phycisphaerales bacterium]
MQLQEDYQVSLEQFHGPLDLLLYLIRRAEVDIHDIPIAQITSEYLNFLKQLKDIDIDVAGEFLLMSATLIEIKSRVLMPAEKREGHDDAGSAADDPADPRYELVQQLLAYQKYRVASEELEARRLDFAQRFAVRPARRKRSAEDEDEHAPEPIELELDDVHALDLSETYERIISSIDLTRLGDHLVEIDDTPIALHQEDLLDRIQRSGENRITLQDAFSGQNIGQRVGMFLATLELVRLRKIMVVQESIDDPVVLVLNEDPDDPNAPHFEERETAAGESSADVS